MSLNNVVLDGREVGSGCEPYVVAEISANHNGKFEDAKKLLQLAKENGAQAVKLQTYRADTITLKSNDPSFMINEGPWAGQSLYELYDKAHTPWEWHEPLFKFAKELDITIFSSPFDETAVDLLEDLSAPFYKIASFEAIDIPLIKYVASTKKPMIISTGMANKEEIEEAVNAAIDGGCNDIILLHCISAYPAPIEDYNLLTLRDLAQKFNSLIGLSDHTTDNVAALVAVSLGARVIEKHFTLNKNAGGPDDFFSMEPEELRQLSKDVLSAWKSLGEINYGLSSSEKGNIKFRRSLYFVKDLKKGERISSEAIKSVRPGYGLKPKFLSQIVGQKLNFDVKANSPVEIKHINWD